MRPLEAIPEDTQSVTTYFTFGKFRALHPGDLTRDKENDLVCPANRVGTVSFNLAGYTPQEAGSVLNETFNIAVRPGLHCSPYAHKTIGTFPDGAVRVSPGHFNTQAELATLLDALQQLAA